MPQEAVGNMQGRVWTKAIDKADLEAERVIHNVISTQLSGGKLFIRIISDGASEAGYVATEPTLEDVYFNTISEKMDLITL